MKATTQAFNRLVDYEVGEVTAAATFYLAETYERSGGGPVGQVGPSGRPV